MGIFLAFKQDMKLPGLWIGITTALLSGSITGCLVVFWTDWDHEVQKVMERMESERDLGNDDAPAESA